VVAAEGTYIWSGERVARVLSRWAFGPVKWPFLIGLTFVGSENGCLSSRLLIWVLVVW
jgi:hypothetical protein